MTTRLSTKPRGGGGGGGGTGVVISEFEDGAYRTLSTPGPVPILYFPLAPLPSPPTPTHPCVRSIRPVVQLECGAGNHAALGRRAHEGPGKPLHGSRQSHGVLRDLERQREEAGRGPQRVAAAQRSHRERRHLRGGVPRDGGPQRDERHRGQQQVAATLRVLAGQDRRMLASDRRAVPTGGGQVPRRPADLRLHERVVGPAHQRRAQHQLGRRDHGHARQQRRRERADVGVRHLAVLRVRALGGAPGKRRRPQLGLQKHPGTVGVHCGSVHVRPAGQQQ